MHNNQLIIELQAQRASLVEQIHLIDAMLKLNGVSTEGAEIGTASNGNTQMPYKKSDNWQAKLAALIVSNDRYISINEAAKMINGFEPKISLDEAKKGLGSAKNIMLKNKLIDKYQYGTNNSNTFYGKPSWKNEDGTIQEKHKYSESALVSKPVIEL